MFPDKILFQNIIFLIYPLSVKPKPQSYQTSNTFGYLLFLNDFIDLERLIVSLSKFKCYL